MTVEEIQHLATLARIALSDEEAQAFAVECDAILHYVEQVRAVSADAAAMPAAGVHANVLRDDVVTHESGVHSDALLAAAPARDGAYVRVKKILGTHDAG